MPRLFARQIAVACLAVGALALAGCGQGSDPNSGLTAAHAKWLQAVRSNDRKTACSMMSPAYQAKVAAERDMASAKCGAVIAAMSAAYAKSAQPAAFEAADVRVDGSHGSLSTATTADGTQVTRMKMYANNSAKGWIFTGDYTLDPGVSVPARRAYAEFLDDVATRHQKGACKLVERASQDSILTLFATGFAWNQHPCETLNFAPGPATHAVPEIIGGTETGDIAILKTLQAVPDVSYAPTGIYYATYVIGLREVNGKWLLNSAIPLTELGNSTLPGSTAGAAVPTAAAGRIKQSR